MKVDVSGNTFHFPPMCACCASTGPLTALPVAYSKSTGKKTVHTSTMAWDIPYCLTCAGHIAALDQARNATTGTFVGTLLIAGLLGLNHVVWAAWLVFALGLAASVFVNLSLTSRANEMRTKSCCGAGRSVAYVYWHGTHHSFDVASQNFALAFMRANAGKLINLDPTTVQWLASNGVVLGSRGQQAPRRYRT